MAWIRLPAPDATPALARLTRVWTRAGKAVPSVMAVLMVAPTVMRTLIGLNNAVTFGGSTLGRRREELIATTVSALSECFY